MVFVLVSMMVEDYGKWRKDFDEHQSKREETGQTGSSRVFQSPDNPNEVTVLLEWNDLEKAKEFMNSDDLKQKMADAGVQGVNTTLFLNET